MPVDDVRAKTEQDFYLSQIRAILDQVLSDCKIYLFGSRATNRHRNVSDFDIGVLAPRDMDRELGLARELLEASNIPFTVDLVDLGAVSGEFARQVQQEGILL